MTASTKHVAAGCEHTGLVRQQTHARGLPWDDIGAHAEIRQVEAVRYVQRGNLEDNRDPLLEMDLSN